MTIACKDDLVVLSGACGVEDALPLADWLAGRGENPPPVHADLSHCTALHTAVLQLLLAGRVTVREHPADPFLATHVAPLLG